MSWKSLRYRLEAWVCEALAWAIPKLSRKGCVRLGQALGALAYQVDGRGRAVALANLECVFGERYTPAERRALACASYQNFTRTMLDLFWAQQLKDENFGQWLKLEGYEETRALLEKEQRGAVFLLLHQGNWELANLSGGFTGLRLAGVAEDFKNPRLTAIFNRLRQHTGQEVIAQDKSLLRMLRIVKKKGLTGLLIDLNLRPSQAATVIEGYGGLAMCMPLLHAVLAQRGDALLLPGETEPFPDGTCRIRIHPPVQYPPGATIPQIAQACWDAMEGIILARPDLYLWAYKHFRYRPKDAVRPYPPYSNESRQFEKLRREIQPA